MARAHETRPPLACQRRGLPEVFLRAREVSPARGRQPHALPGAVRPEVGDHPPAFVNREPDTRHPFRSWCGVGPPLRPSVRISGPRRPPNISAYFKENGGVKVERSTDIAAPIGFPFVVAKQPPLKVCATIV
jgi:hypothetical protein